MDPYTSARDSGVLNGIEIPVVGLADPEYQHRLTSIIYPNGTVQFRSGTDLELLLLLQFVFNFTYKAIDGEGWIDHLANGSWSGIGRQIQDEEAVLSITQSSMLPYRVASFYFLLSTAKGNVMAFFRQPSESSTRNMLTSVFSPHVWVSLLFMGSLVILSVKLTHHVKKKMGMSTAKDLMFAQEAVFLVLGSFCQISVSVSPWSIPIRIMYLSLLTTTCLSYVGFSAALMAHLAIEIVPIRSFADLIQSDMPLFGDISVPYIFPVVESLQRLKGQGGTRKQNFMDVKTGVGKMTKGRTSFVTYADAVNTAFQQLSLTDHYVCNNIYQFKISSAVNGMPSGMFLKKGSPLREPFNQKISMFYERGFMKRINDKMDSQIYPRCLSKHKSSTPSLGLNDVYTAFVFLIAGIVLSFMGLVIEVWYLFIVQKNKLY